MLSKEEFLILLADDDVRTAIADIIISDKSLLKMLAKDLVIEECFTDKVLSVVWSCPNIKQEI